jgi:putative transposase
MTRIARVVIPGIAHHITQRGNNRADVFFVDDDRRFFLGLLRKHSQQNGLIIDGYCLMTNHIHIIATPVKEDSLSKTLGKVNYLYSRYVNRLHNRSGHLWQSRFFSCPLDEYYYFRALRYIECNPVRARLCRYPWAYPWSSSKAHIDNDDRGYLLDMKKWRFESRGLDWKKVLLDKAEDEDIELIRKRSFNGRPLGSDSFMSKIEHKLGRRLRPLPMGRPKKKVTKESKKVKKK